MRSRKHTAWKKSRTFGDVFGGRTSPKITDRIVNRVHSLRAPGPGIETPILIEDNPSRDYYFPLSIEECRTALHALPASHYEGLTHLWLRRPSGVDRRNGLPLAEFLCGSGVRLIVMYPWRVDRRTCLGRLRPAGNLARELERFGATFVRDRGWWYAQLDPDALREYYLHVLYHEVGHHLDWYQRRWSAANMKQVEAAADQYAVRFLQSGKTVLGQLD
ncbi:MAG: hypothetical protein IT456_00995 [Planctomycetes bacterium]|nr:hypothetical protein [Planctomycetota bacterium]